MDKTCLIIAGAPEKDIEYVKNIIVKENPTIICADGGYKHCLNLNITPDILIGDLDSLHTDNIPSSCNIIKLRPDKDDSDLKECVNHAISKGFNNIIITCASGGRADHYLSNLSILEYINEKGVKAIFYDNNNRIYFQKDSETTYDADNSFKYIGIIPLDKELRGVTLTGLKYPLEKATISRHDIITISNEAISQRFTVEINQGSAYIIYTRD